MASSSALDGARQPDVSVVIPTRDRYALLATTLTSVIEQQDVVLEVIIVDDSSTPAPSAGAPWEDPRLRVVRPDVCRGLAAARNVGIGAARGAWVAFLDDDDLWAPSKLRAQLDAAEAAGATFAYSAAVRFGRDAGALKFLPAPDPRTLRESLRSLNCVPAGASNVIVRAAALDEVGGFDTRLSHLADWDMWIRLAGGGPAAACDQPHVGYRLHAGNMRSSVGGVHRELRALDRKHRHGSVRSPARLEIYRWLVEGQLLAGRRVSAARTQAVGAVHCRSLGELKRARELLFATATTRPGTIVRSSRRHAVLDDGAVAWLSHYVDAAACTEHG
ncbi:MAG TPA: glycosyltransferase family A protein [Solirubrobacteraceae bacterium]|nr:glycosyltransferase family A protein [Solirubrobacteraceae bacterium]